MSGARYYYLARHVWDEELQCWILPEPAGGRVVGSVDLSPSDQLGLVFASTDVPYGKDQFDYDLSAGGTRLDEFTTSPVFRAMWEEAFGVKDVPAGTLLDLLWAHLTDYADPTGETRCKPLMPTHRNVLMLTLGGHSVVRQRKFTGVDDPHWNKVCAVHSRDYPAILADAQRRAGKPGADINQKWLGSLAQQYRIPMSEIGKLIIPKVYPQVQAKRPTTTISDNFNRADGAIGANWLEWSSEWTIDTNRIKTVSAGGSPRAIRYTTGLSSANHYSQCDYVVTTNVLEDVGAVSRIQPSGGSDEENRYYYMGSARTNGQVYLKRAGTELATYNGTVELPTTIRIVSDGSAHAVYQDGVQRIEPTTDTNYTGIYTGIAARIGWPGAMADNFVASDELAGGSPHYYYLQQQAAMS